MKTIYSSGITTFATIVNGALGAVFYFYLARILGPVEFGLLTLAITSLTLVTDISELGINNAIVRFIPANIVSNKHLSYQLLKTALKLKLLVGISISIIGLILAEPLAQVIFNKSELIQLLQIGFIGIIGLLLFSYLTSTLQSLQKFFTWSKVIVSSNLLRLGLLVMVSGYFTLTSNFVMIIFILAPLIIFLFSLKSIDLHKIIKTKGDGEVTKQIFSYSRWVALFTLIAALSSRLDTFLVGRLVSPEELGIYGAANQIVMVVPQVVSALGVVAAPKFAGFSTKHQMWEFFKKLQLMVIAFGALILLVIPIASLLIQLVYGDAYFSATTPFIILLLAMIVFLVSVPVHNAIFYFFGRPQFFVVMSLIHLIIIATLGPYLIDIYGITGAAISVLVGMIANFIIPMIWFLIKMRT